MNENNNTDNNIVIVYESQQKSIYLRLKKAFVQLNKQIFSFTDVINFCGTWNKIEIASDSITITATTVNY